MSNEDGRFYLESTKSYTAIINLRRILRYRGSLDKTHQLWFKVLLSEAESLKEVVILPVKLLKDNPALWYLRKIWERKRKNGLSQFDQYQMEKYEKVEFDMNTIDSAFMKSNSLKEWSLFFQHIDTRM
jgi:hypothetical protein